jgi:hypothetical protein
MPLRRYQLRLFHRLIVTHLPTGASTLAAVVNSMAPVISQPSQPNPVLLKWRLEASRIRNIKKVTLQPMIPTSPCSTCTSRTGSLHKDAEPFLAAYGRGQRIRWPSVTSVASAHSPSASTVEQVARTQTVRLVFRGPSLHRQSTSESSQADVGTSLVRQAIYAKTEKYQKSVSYMNISWSTSRYNSQRSWGMFGVPAKPDLSRRSQ